MESNKHTFNKKERFVIIRNKGDHMSEKNIIKLFKESLKNKNTYIPNPVSYTHLDVYKRQILYYTSIELSLK